MSSKHHAVPQQAVLDDSSWLLACLASGYRNLVLAATMGGLSTQEKT